MNMTVEKKKIVITGGPGTGKTSIIDALKDRDFYCLPEISRQVTLEARKMGIEQLFLTDPLLFSRKLLEGRVKQFENAKDGPGTWVFFDRGIPDTVAYMDYIGDQYPPIFEEYCKQMVYDQIFILPPWEEIYISDNERYENYDQALMIHEHLKQTYLRYGYELFEVPTGTVNERTDFILASIK